MNFSDVCARFVALRFPGAGDDAHPDREAILDVRERVRQALTGDEFLTDCISYELAAIESDRVRRGLVPFYVLPDAGIRFCFGYWPPGGTPGPHEHTAWTITAVCRNRLDVATFDRAESYRRRSLVAKHVFEAQAGQVGFIYDPSIHAPKNNSSDWSLSLHIMSPRDGLPLPGVEPLAELASPVPAGPAQRWQPAHPFAHVLRERTRHREYALLAGTLLTIRQPRALDLLATRFHRASASTRRQLMRALPGRCTGFRTTAALIRSHCDLGLSVRRSERGCALWVETPRGAVQALAVNDLAYEALAFASHHASFEVAALPGALSNDERATIADALEDAGLFKRVEA